MSEWDDFERELTKKGESPPLAGPERPREWREWMGEVWNVVPPGAMRMPRELHDDSPVEVVLSEDVRKSIHMNRKGSAFHWHWGLSPNSPGRIVMWRKIDE